MRRDPALIVSIGALIVSAISFALTYQLNRTSQATAVKPVLVFEYDNGTGWMLRNLGNGPALNILVAQKEVGGDWFNPVRVPPLAAGGSFIPKWLGHTNTTGLGVIYVDVRDRKYSSTTGNDLTRIEDGFSFGPWTEDEIGKHWQIVPYDDG